MPLIFKYQFLICIYLLSNDKAHNFKSMIAASNFKHSTSTLECNLKSEEKEVKETNQMHNHVSLIFNAHYMKRD